MKHTSEEDTVKVKMNETFQCRRKMILDPQRSMELLTEFPPFLDVKGLIEQDFVRIFGEKTSARFLVIHQSKSLHISQDLQELIDAAELSPNKAERDYGWDSDLASILLLPYLIPPSPQGRKRPGKMSASQAEKHLVVFRKWWRQSQHSMRHHFSDENGQVWRTGVKRRAVRPVKLFLNGTDQRSKPLLGLELKKSVCSQEGKTLLCQLGKLGLEDKVSPQQAHKKWDNLKKKYKVPGPSAMVAQSCSLN
ncbi:uncharacterized protein LOC134336304 isoform X2 [Trichomycterus rosablanca]|uniref:uncharacterized protein LOC134336304 isoform X2 n=1 Tax=Trichomycterus rosablanca TaxID=2290929 RepID=UPI002F358C8A